MIRDTPSEIYRYALPFSPSSSWVHTRYRPKLMQEVEVVKGLPEGWGACLYTIPFDHKPQVLTYWKDLVAVGLDSGDIVIVDVITGIRTSGFSGHTCLVGSLAFSPDGTFLVSGSDDKTIALWDIRTGGLETVYSGHTGRVLSVSISRDHSMIASGSDDKTIRLWDTRTGVCFCIIDGHAAAVNSVGFSTRGARFLLSASEDHTVRRWATELQIGSQIGSNLGDYVALSSRGTSFVSWGRGVADVRKSHSGAVVAQLVAPDGPLRHCCFSPGGRFVAGAIHDTIFVWVIDGSPRLIHTIDASPHLIQAPILITYPISSLAFSPSLILSSHDQAIKFWRLDALSTDSVAADPVSTQPSIESARSAPPVIKSGKPSSIPVESISLQAWEGIAITHDSAGVARIWDTSTGDLTKSIEILAPELEWGDAELIGNTLTFGWFAGKGIYLWDTERGHFLKVDLPQFYRPWDFRISVKGSKVFLLDGDYIRAWSIDTGNSVGEVKLEGEPLFNSLVVCYSRVWVRFKDSDSPIQGWDFGSNSLRPVPLSSTFSFPLPRPHLAFIDRTETWYTGPSRIEDTETGEEVFRLSGRYGKPTVARWDGRHLVAGYDTGEVLILNQATMKVIICTAHPNN